MSDWLALVIGNTRWHWAWFQNNQLKQVWHTDHLTKQVASNLEIHSIWADQVPPQLLNLSIETTRIWAVSVVPDQTQTLAHIPRIRWINQIPLRGVYDTMGLDRVLSLWGAGQQYGWPILVIDGGTALTFTAGADSEFMGGAIALGVRSHLSALHHYTAALPKVDAPIDLPYHWATNTSSAIQSGVIHTILASIHQFIYSWRQRYHEATILFTGGDGKYLHRLYLQQFQTEQNQAQMNRTWFDPNLMFWGISAYRNDETRLL
ncbi:MAG: pantothenate kinase [Cyanobacteria bacterium P01_H01_bin.105]